MFAYCLLRAEHEHRDKTSKHAVQQFFSGFRNNGNAIMILHAWKLKAFSFMLLNVKLPLGFLLLRLWAFHFLSVTAQIEAFEHCYITVLFDFQYFSQLYLNISC